MLAHWNVRRQLFVRRHRTFHHVATGNGGFLAKPGEQVARHQGASCLLERKDGVPAVGHLRRDQESEFVAPEIEHLVVGHDLRRTDGKIVDVDRDAQFAVDRFGLRGELEEFIEGPGFVRLQVRP